MRTVNIQKFPKNMPERSKAFRARFRLISNSGLFCSSIRTQDQKVNWRVFKKSFQIQEEGHQHTQDGYCSDDQRHKHLFTVNFGDLNAFEQTSETKEEQFKAVECKIAQFPVTNIAFRSEKQQKNPVQTKEKGDGNGNRRHRNAGVGPANPRFLLLSVFLRNIEIRQTDQPGQHSLLQSSVHSSAITGRYLYM